MNETHFVMLKVWIAIFHSHENQSKPDHPFFHEVDEENQHVMFYPRQEIFRRYQVYRHIRNLIIVTRHFPRFICDLFHLK